MLRSTFSATLRHLIVLFGFVAAGSVLVAVHEATTNPIVAANSSDFGGARFTASSPFSNFRFGTDTPFTTFGAPAANGFKFASNFTFAKRSGDFAPSRFSAFAGPSRDDADRTVGSGFGQGGSYVSS